MTTDTTEIAAIYNAPLINTYNRAEVILVKGQGCELFDVEGKRYLDCLAGIAVVSAGHSNPQIVEAVCEQARKLTHVSNLYWTEPMACLAIELQRITGWGRSFFANSGAEANECAIKLARKWAKSVSSVTSDSPYGKFKIICAEKSFHGRTLKTLAATGQPAKWKGFEPLPQGFVHCPLNDLEAFEAAIDGETAAIMLEPIQGESGISPATEGFLRGIRALCDKFKLALIFDEIQCGMGRTGSWWAFQQLGVKPDIFTTAKALGNGLPIGACIAEEPFASAFGAGDHGSTFGGNPIAAQAALATIRYLDSKGVLSKVSRKSELFKKLLNGLPGVKEIRGSGLMLAVALEIPEAKAIASACLDGGLLINAIGDDCLRLTPPLVISESEIEEACGILKGVLLEKAGK